MGQIQVFIPASGKTVAVPERKAVLWGETLNWHIHCDNPDVHQVQIEFMPHSKDMNRLPMFGNKASQPHLLVKLISDKGSGDNTRTACIAGHVPVHQYNGTRRRNDKYTIVGLDADGAPVPGTELDPEIITTDPGGD